MALDGVREALNILDDTRRSLVRFATAERDNHVPIAEAQMARRRILIGALRVLGPAAPMIAAVIARGRGSADPFGRGISSDLPYSAKNDHGQPKEHWHGYPPFPERFASGVSLFPQANCACFRVPIARRVAPNGSGM